MVATSSNQMPPDYIIFIVFFLVLLYVYSQQTSDLTTAAATIRQIFSGGCHLNCQNSEFRSYSCLHSTTQAVNFQAGTSRGCMCETCPCAFIENVYITCNPATRLFSIIQGTVTQFYYEILAAINGIFDRLTTIIHCQISCQRQDQVGGRTRCDDPTENFTLDGGMTVTKEECANQVSSPGPSLRKSSTAAPSKNNESKSKETDSDQKVTTSDRVNQSDTVKPDTSCPKCVEKGKICLTECPKANK